MSSQPYATAPPIVTDGHDAPQSLSPISMTREEEGLQRLEYPGENAEAPQAMTSYSQRRASLAQSNSSRLESDSVARGTVTTMPYLSEDNPRDAIAPNTFPRSELDALVIDDSSTNGRRKEPSVEVAAINSSNWRWLRVPFLHWANPRRRFWRYILPVLTLCLLAILIAMAVLYLKLKKNGAAPLELIITVTQLAAALPMTDTAISATTVLYGSYFTSPSSSSGLHDTNLVYTTKDGRICIMTKTGGTWLSNIQCIANLSPKPHTPLAILDWLGGPSIYFINTANQLCGIDNIPSNNTWKLSNVVNEKVIVHPQSQLASVTWLNGTSSWLYYQDTNAQLREYGLYDYRDTQWELGATGPLGLALAGTSIGLARYLMNGSEVLEMFIQTSNNAIHGRVYQDSVWGADFFAVDNTDTGLGANAGLSAGVVGGAAGEAESESEEEVMLAWVGSTGFLNVQTRRMSNVSSYSTFSSPVQVVEGDGGSQPGVAVLNIVGVGEVYFADAAKILESGNETGNWTTVDVISL